MTSLLLGTASAAIGFYFGRRQSTLEGRHSLTTEDFTTVEETDQGEDADEDEDEEDDDEGIADGDLAAITPGFAEPCKMVRATNNPTLYSTRTGRIKLTSQYGKNRS